MRFRLYLITVMGALFTATSVALPMSTASALSGSDFQAGNIISDSVFYDSDSMSSAQVQNFLNAKLPTCDTNGTAQKSYHYRSSDGRINNGADPTVTTSRATYGQRYATWYNAHPYPGYITNGSVAPYTCLKDYKQNTPDIAGESGICGNFTAKTARSAAGIITDVAAACGISPKALIVLLQKEQGLVTDVWPWDGQFLKATGFGCPDTTGCNEAYYGFFNQVYRAARQFKLYQANPTNYNFVAGQNNDILWNPNASCGSKTVYIATQATAGLYDYTPYQPNKAALDNLYGTGDGCSAYGNRNFWRYYNDWFGPTTGTPFFRISGSSKTYITGANNTYYYVTSPSMMTSYGYGGFTTKIDVVSSSFVSGKTFKGNLPHIARFEADEVYIMNEGKRHHIPSREMFDEYGYTLGQEAFLPSSIQYYFPEAETVSNVLKRSDGSGTYYVEGGKKRHITGPSAYTTLGSPVYSSQPLVTLDSYFVDTLPDGGPIMVSGYYTRSTDSNKFWVWDGSEMHPVSAATVNTWRIPLSYQAPESVLMQLPVSTTSYGIYGKDSNGEYYILDTGNKLKITATEISGHGLSTTDFQLLPAGLLGTFNDKNFVDLQLVRKFGSDPVYKIVNDKLYFIYSRDELGYFNLDLRDTIPLSQNTLDLFTNQGNILLMGGRVIRSGNQDAVTMIDQDSTMRHVPSRAIFEQYGYTMGEVISLGTAAYQQFTESGQLQRYAKYNDGSRWLIDNTRRMKIPESLLPVYNLTDGQFVELSQPALSRLKTNPNLTDIIISPSGAVYKVESGKKRWFATRDSFERHHSWDEVRQVSNNYLATLPDGAVIR